MEFLAKGKSLKESYSLMVNNYPYRILSNATYDWEESPIADDVSVKVYYFINRVPLFIISFKCNYVGRQRWRNVNVHSDTKR